MIYKHYEEEELRHAPKCPSTSVYGLRFSGAVEGMSQRAFELRSRIEAFPDDIDAVLDAVELAKQVLGRPMYIQMNHYNVQTIRGLFLDSVKYATTGQRDFTVDHFAVLLEKDDPTKHDQLVQGVYRWNISRGLLAKWMSNLQGVNDILCVISTLTLLQK